MAVAHTSRHLTANQSESHKLNRLTFPKSSPIPITLALNIAIKMSGEDCMYSNIKQRRYAFDVGDSCGLDGDIRSHQAPKLGCHNIKILDEDPLQYKSPCVVVVKYPVNKNCCKKRDIINCNVYKDIPIGRSQELLKHKSYNGDSMTSTDSGFGDESSLQYDPKSIKDVIRHPLEIKSFSTHDDFNNDSHLQDTVIKSMNCNKNSQAKDDTKDNFLNETDESCSMSFDVSRCEHSTPQMISNLVTISKLLLDKLIKRILSLEEKVDKLKMYEIAPDVAQAVLLTQILCRGVITSNITKKLDTDGFEDNYQVKSVKDKLIDEQKKDLKVLESDGNTKDENICGAEDFHEVSNANSLYDKISVPAATLQQCLQSINRENQR